MKVAILKTKIPVGNEEEYDLGLIQGLIEAGHTLTVFAPRNYPLKYDSGIKTEFLEGGELISYHNVGLLKKTFLSLVCEIRLQRWLNHASLLTQQDGYDLIIVPSAKPRFLKSLSKSNLCQGKIPIIVNLQKFSFDKKGRLDLFFSIAKKLEKYRHVHITITSPNHAFTNLPNVSYIDPPFFGPTLIKTNGLYDGHEPLTIGLYGYYHHDLKNRMLFKVLATATFLTPIRVIMQTLTTNDLDAKSCQELVNMYKDNPRFSFIGDYLNNEEWQKAIDDADIILLPYASMQYVYSYSSLCFNALGFNKPVMLSPTVNPELLTDYNIGISLDFDDEERLKHRIEKFINTFKEKYPEYQKEIQRAKTHYNFTNVVRDMLTLIK